jgi:hypothetical protein
VVSLEANFFVRNQRKFVFQLWSVFVSFLDIEMGRGSSQRGSAQKHKGKGAMVKILYPNPEFM